MTTNIVGTINLSLLDSVQQKHFFEFGVGLKFTYREVFTIFLPHLSPPQKGESHPKYIFQGHHNASNLFHKLYFN